MLFLLVAAQAVTAAERIGWGGVGAGVAFVLVLFGLIAYSASGD